MYKHIFGPVPSRRLGMSLGVDLVPHKVCSLNCIYCECGKTNNLTVERKEYVSCDEVTNELDDYFDTNPDPDYITFSGSGEPTLNSKFGDILNFIKNKKPDIPVAVLTNGTLFSDKKVREELLKADLILPSLDAASENALKKINRPENSIEIEAYIHGLIDFRKEYSGKIWLEVLIIPGFNDEPEDLKLLKEAIGKINPDRIQLNTLDRPGVINNIYAASRSKLNEIADFLNFDNIEIIASTKQRKSNKSYRNDMETTIMETIFRRPCTLDDLIEILGSHVNEINKYLDVLESEGKIESIRQGRGIFYQVANKA